jgi:hypothetical protein
MAKKTKTTTTIKHKLMKVALLLPAVAGMAAGLFSAAKFEVAAIRKRLILLFILAVFCCILLTSAWVCVNALLIVYLMSFNMSLACSITLAFFFNLFILISTCLAIAVLKIDASILKHGHSGK